jgi:hypothetical protein
MKEEHLEELVNDYKNSIKTVVDKKILWETVTKKLIISTLNGIVKKHNIGWRVQELSWINTNEAVNITFDSFPPELIESTNKIPSFQFIQGAALVFSQSYSGDVTIFILYPILENFEDYSNGKTFDTYTPKTITEKLIVEKVEDFIKKMISWEVPTIENKVGF